MSSNEEKQPKILVWDYNFAQKILVWDYNFAQKILVWDYNFAQKILVNQSFSVSLRLKMK
nr:hypothetical protein [uncultured Prevotella sp.]